MFRDFSTYNLAKIIYTFNKYIQFFNICAFNMTISQNC